jgi:Ca2+-binding EF-hand superfamily protein
LILRSNNETVNDARNVKRWNTFKLKHLTQVDVDGNGTLDLSEFMNFMNNHFCSWNPANDLQSVFRLLDPKVMSI